MSKEVLIYCDAYNCDNNHKGKCHADTIHLQVCTPDADNVLGCSEFLESIQKGGEK